MGDPLHDKGSDQFVARYIERAPLSLEKLFIQDDIVAYSTKDGVAHSAQEPESEPESDYRSEFHKNAWAACINRIYEIDPLECSRCKAQMRIIAFIQDTHTISDIMKAEGLPDFRALPAIPKFIDTSQAIDELSSCDSSSSALARYGGTGFEPSPDDF